MDEEKPAAFGAVLKRYRCAPAERRPRRARGLSYGFLRKPLAAGVTLPG